MMSNKISKSSSEKYIEHPEIEKQNYVSYTFTDKYLGC